MLLLAQLALAGDPVSPPASEAAPTAAQPSQGLPPLPPDVKEVHWTAVEVKVRATVRASDFPGAAGLPSVGKCTVRVTLDELGAPVAADVAECTPGFEASAQGVALRYRFYPYKEEGVPRKAAFLLTINFKKT